MRRELELKMLANIRGGTEEEWLVDAERVYDRYIPLYVEGADGNKYFKIGDGKSEFKDLPYIKTTAIKSYTPIDGDSHGLGVGSLWCVIDESNVVTNLYIQVGVGIWYDLLDMDKVVKDYLDMYLGDRGYIRWSDIDEDGSMCVFITPEENL